MCGGGVMAARPDPSDSWRNQLLTRTGTIFFFGGAPLLIYFAATIRAGLVTVLASWVPVLAAALAARNQAWPLRARGAQLVAALIVGGAVIVRFSGPTPGMIAYFSLAAVLCTLVIGRGPGLVVLAIGAVCIVVLGSLGREHALAVWEEELPHYATWVRFAMTYSILTGTLVLVVSDAVRRVERDAEQRRVALDRLAESENRYRTLFDGNPLPMLVYDPETTRLLAVNEASVTQYGYTRDELLRMTVGDLAVPGDPHYPEFLAGLGKPRPAVVHVGHRQQQRRDGSIVDIDITSLEVPFAGRLGRLTLARDITPERQGAEERARLEAALRSSETMAALGSIVAGVAHEVRNPLFSISATLDALEAEYGNQQGYAEYAALLRAQVQRLKQLTRDLLEYGKPAKLRLAEVKAEELVRVAVRNCALVAREQGVSVLEEAAVGLPPIQADPVRMQGVLENLVTNAIQHSPRGSTVVVRSALVDPTTLGFSVEDEGVGIAKADLPRLFEPFFSRRKGGTGLGLSIVQRIVEAHGGSVTAENRARGAAFRVQLPLSPAQEVARGA
jgi:PAS domain S-box-containing protein